MSIETLLEKMDSILEGKTEKIDLDWIGDPKLAKEMSKKYKIQIKITGDTTADISGDPKNIIKYLTSDNYSMDPKDVKFFFPQLF